MTSENLKLGILIGAVLSIAVAGTNVIFPSVIGHPSADSELTESVGWALIIALICFLGFLKVRRTARIRDSAIAGTVITFIAFAMTMTTFLVIDNVFLSIVSQQPEKIWLFERSGYPNMRSYLNHTNLRAFWTALPLITLLGGACGLVGGCLNWWASRDTSR